MKPTTRDQYRARLLKVVDYIYHNVDQELSVNRLADIALMSPYHFHRIYREMAQETLNASVRRLRLHYAAGSLIRSDMPIAKIATKVAYGSAEAFARAFVKEFGETPSAYREQRQGSTTEPFVAMLPKLAEEHRPMHTVNIENFPGAKLAALEHRGDYMKIGHAFEKLAITTASLGLVNDKPEWFGVYYDDSHSVPEASLRAHAGLRVNGNVDISSNDLEAVEIPAGSCATLVFKGPYAELETPYNWFYGQWLPESGREAANFPPFEQYLNDARSTPPSELLTKIHILLN